MNTNEQRSVELKPCPFCGSGSDLLEVSYPLIGVRFNVYCLDDKDENCGVVLDCRSVSELGAEAAWNRRFQEVKRC